MVANPSGWEGRDRRISNLGWEIYLDRIDQLGRMVRQRGADRIWASGRVPFSPKLAVARFEIGCAVAALGARAWGLGTRERTHEFGPICHQFSVSGYLPRWV